MSRFMQPYRVQPPRFTKRGFTLIELLVVIAIIAILASILFPVFARARENARRASCQSNLKQINLGFMQYTQDYDERLPLTTDGAAGQNILGGWNYYTFFGGNTGASQFDMSKSSLQPYIKNVQLFVCPSDSKGSTQGNSYAANSCVFYSTATNSLRAGKSLAAFDETARWMLLAEETNTGALATGSTDDAYLTVGNDISTRHFDGSNLGFMDGHVKFYRRDRIYADGYQIGGTAPVVQATTTCP
jgi:prepilin-type N-terminal cleavage/methylation domain-containing protein/prepilin-type processing-associated H-X9-DG protein